MLSLGEAFLSAPSPSPCDVCPLQLPLPGYFITKIFHPNVSASGEICVNVLKRDWRPDLGLRHVLTVIRCLLIEPNAESGGLQLRWHGWRGGCGGWQPRCMSSWALLPANVAAQPAHLVALFPAGHCSAE